MNQVMQEYEPVIGLEVHLQLATASKVFCGCANEFGGEPNSRVCPVCLGLPGSLPVLNKKALEYAIKIALALNCKVNPYIKFDRKNYYYPDLPKAYQISQYDNPIASDGYIMVHTDGGSFKKVRINRAHLEEDAGKLVHDSNGNCSLVDYNRTGTPLMEIVSEPDIFSPTEAYEYLQSLKLLLQYLGVSDCDMEKGSLRCDANVSIRKKGEVKLGVKTELKNMNSFKAVKAALEYEIGRHKKLVCSGREVLQETRLWNEERQATFVMRSKEDAHDYRYFPEPDLVPFVVDQQVIDEIRASLPELPMVKFNRFLKEYSVSEYDARILVQDKNLASFFEECLRYLSDVKKVCNWVNGPLLKELNSRKITITEICVSAKELTNLIKKVENGELSNLAAKDVLRFMVDTGKGVDEIIKEKDLAQVSDDTALEKLVDEIVAENEKVVLQIKQGKESAIGFLVGQGMKKTKGKANPKKIGKIIREKLLG